MTQTAKRRTMYMHTLEGKPASYADNNGPYIHFVGGVNKVKLASSLRQIRHEQHLAIEAAQQFEITMQWADAKIYGYVLVEVPS